MMRKYIICKLAKLYIGTLGLCVMKVFEFWKNELKLLFKLLL